MLAVPRDSPNCKKHSEETNSHEREYNIGKDLNLKIVLTKKCGAKFYKTKLRVRKYKGLSLLKNQGKGKKKDWPLRHRNWSHWKEKQKDTFDLNSSYNFNEMKFSWKTNGLAVQKDQENDK